MDATTLVMLAVALLIGLAKGGFGALGPLVVPLLATQMPVSDAIGLALPLLIVGDWPAVRFYWRKWDGRHIRLLLPGALPGIVLGLLLLTALSDDALRRTLGVFTLLIAAYKVASDMLTSVRYTHHDWHGRAAGAASGFASALANAGGPPITSYLLLQSLTPTVFVATNAIFFAVVNLLKLPFFLGSGVLDLDLLARYVWVVPLIPLGVWVGRGLITRINRRVFEALVLIGLLWTGFSYLLG